MLLDLLFFILSTLLFLPLVTGYCAYSYGRSFWLWFVLGCGLPYISFIGLIVSLHRKELNPGERLVAEAKAILVAQELKSLAAVLSSNGAIHQADH
ncbi:hypothetical protein Q5H93_06520 [Hymenobacter sp. ASUV-10]|uniref:Uncharacterized protein n=1 Tax=Hymenobacter aranciens TaxID=3063996 RepID=A0ABT9B7Y9_9BACT|nr:hypothetical protein [Hymenobacter sp. ASUV-10]MDO7874380.1 hypothetical protein [Hymenobacter sp. ASUV-10]